MINLYNIIVAFVVTLLLTTSSVSNAATINIADAILEKVKKLDEIKRIPGVTIALVDPKFFPQKIAWTNTLKSIPVSIKRYKFTLRNCDDGPIKMPATTTFKLTETIQATVKKGLQIGSSKELSLGLGDQQAPFNLRTGISKNLNISLENESSIGKSEDSEYKIEEPDRGANGKTARIVDAQFTRFIKRFYFKAPIVVDGIIQATYPAQSVGASTPIVMMLTHNFDLHDLIKNDSDRTFKASGYIETSFYEQHDVMYLSVPLSEGDCKYIKKDDTIEMEDSEISLLSDEEAGEQLEGQYGLQNLVEEISDVISVIPKDLISPIKTPNALFTDSDPVKTQALSTKISKKAVTRLFFARGTHQCWDEKNIGSRCEVRGSNYTDCNTAFYSLKRNDCCKSTKKGASISFKLTKCSNVTP